MSLNFTHLAAFAAVAEARSFTRGAERLGVSQPAVSTQVGALERRLGVQLIERSAQAFTLTEAGTVLLTAARRVFALADDAERTLVDLSSLRRGRLRLGATPTIGTYLLPRTLVYFRERFPDITLTVEIADHGTVLHQLDDHLLDAVLTTRPADAGSTSATPFADDQVVAVVSPDHALGQRKRLTANDLAGARVILRDGPQRTPGFAERALRARRLLPADVMRVPHTESVKQAALARLGVAFVPLMVVQDDLAAGRLMRVSIPGFRCSRPALWLERASEKRTKAAQAYWCILKHAVRGSLPPMKRRVATPG